MFGSSVEPDLLATTTSVSARLTSLRAVLHLLRIGGIDDAQLGKPGCWPKVTASTSGQRLEPPMPSSRTVWKSAVSPPRPARQRWPDPAAGARRCRSSPAISPRRRESTGWDPSARSGQLCCWRSSRRRPGPRRREVLGVVRIGSSSRYLRIVHQQIRFFRRRAEVVEVASLGLYGKPLQQ
jgi:hypothetical protein